MTASDVAIFVVLPIIVWGALLIAWWRSYSGFVLSLSPWRQIVFRVGLIGNTLSILLLSVFLIFVPMLRRELLLSSGLLSALLTVVLGPFGRGLPRFLVTANGLVLVLLWYMLGLANSP